MQPLGLELPTPHRNIHRDSHEYEPAHKPTTKQIHKYSSNPRPRPPARTLRKGETYSTVQFNSLTSKWSVHGYHFTCFQGYSWNKPDTYTRIYIEYRVPESIVPHIFEIIFRKIPKYSKNTLHLKIRNFMCSAEDMRIYLEYTWNLP